MSPAQSESIFLLPPVGLDQACPALKKTKRLPAIFFFPQSLNVLEAAEFWDFSMLHLSGAWTNSDGDFGC